MMYERLKEAFAARFGGRPRLLFSAPGRTELGGNHTDHQRGLVLAAAVSAETLAAVAPNGRREIRLLSEGYPLCTVGLDSLEPRPEERGCWRAILFIKLTAKKSIICQPTR